MTITNHQNIAPPTFIFSAGWRSGSTLVQRLVTSTGQILVWGEVGGALNSIADAFERYRQMLGPGGERFRHGFGGEGLAQYEAFRTAPASGMHQWIACMNPPEDVVLASFRKALEAIYAVPAAALGYQRWGVKEVQSGLDTALFLRRLWPNAKFVFLIRSPYACLLSIKRRGWIDWPGGRSPVRFFAEHWQRLAADFRQADFGLLVRYEDLVNDPDALLNLCKYLDIQPVDANFLRESRADWQAQNRAQLTAWERWQARRILGAEMRRHGYSE